MNIRPTVAKRRGITPRLFLALIDREPHCLSEIWDWLVDPIDPPRAVRRFLRSGPSNDNGSRREKAATDPEWAVAEGRRIQVLEMLSQLRKDGRIEARIPEPEPQSMMGRDKKWIDVRKAVVRLTPAGMDHLLNGRGVLSKSIGELILGLRREELDFSVYPNKKRIPPKEEEPCTPARSA